MHTLILLVLLGGLDQAKVHFEAGEFEQALKAAAEVPARDDNYARSRYLMGEIELLLGNAAGARDSFQAAAKARPNSEPILTGLGRALIALEETDEAQAALERAVKANPKSGLAYCYLGIAKHAGGKGGKEVAKGVKLAPRDADVARAAVLFWLEDGNDAKAGKAAKRFSSLRKDSPMGPFLHALVLEREKKYGKAIEAYQKALKRDDTFLDAHKNLAILCTTKNPLYRDKERTEKAFRHYEKYFELGGNDPELEQTYRTIKGYLEQYVK